MAEVGGGNLPPKIRGSARMIASLAKAPAWVDGMSPEMRAKLVGMLEAGLEGANQREVASIAKALAMLERNDVERTKLLVEHESAIEGEQDEARRLLATVREIERIEGGA